MSVYAIAQGRIDDPELLRRYVAQAIPTIEQHGGKILAFDESPEIVEGQIAYPRTVILEFESREALGAWYDAPAYPAALPLRLESAPGTLVVVDGIPGA